MYYLEKILVDGKEEVKSVRYVLNFGYFYVTNYTARGNKIVEKDDILFTLRDVETKEVIQVKDIYNYEIFNKVDLPATYQYAVISPLAQKLRTMVLYVGALEVEFISQATISNVMCCSDGLLFVSGSYISNAYESILSYIKHNDVKDYIDFTIGTQMMNDMYIVHRFRILNNTELKAFKTKVCFME